MMTWIKAACVLAAATLAACAGGNADDKPLVLSREANAHFQKYLHEIQQGRAGAFAVNEGGDAAFYSVCESGSCNGQYGFSSQAIKGCEKFGRGHCVLLASNSVVKRQYTVAN